MVSTQDLGFHDHIFTPIEINDPSIYIGIEASLMDQTNCLNEGYHAAYCIVTVM